MLHKLCSHFSGISSALKATCYSSNRRNLERSGCGVLTLHRVVELSDPRESSTNHKDTTTAKANPSNERTQINSPKWPSRIASGQSMKPKPPLSIKGERDISPRSQGASTKDESMSAFSITSQSWLHGSMLCKSHGCHGIFGSPTQLTYTIYDYTSSIPSFPLYLQVNVMVGQPLSKKLDWLCGNSWILW